MKWRLSLLLLAVMAAAVIVFHLAPIPQSEAYHNFADQRTLLGIPNCLNVLSNALFLIVGVLGMKFIWSDRPRGPLFVEARERWAYITFFLAVALTAFGSAWYHLNPNDATLVWDRIPMAIGFMALLAAVVAERISVRLGVSLIVPLAALGVASVIYWSVTQSRGHGDLRAYALMQSGSLLVLILLLALFPPRYTRGADFIASLGIYALAKVFEAADRPIYSSLGGIVSGHTLKHIAAAISTYWILRMLKLRDPLPSREESA
jgi:hypothetical protein